MPPSRRSSSSHHSSSHVSHHSSSSHRSYSSPSRHSSSSHHSYSSFSSPSRHSSSSRYTSSGSYSSGSYYSHPESYSSVSNWINLSQRRNRFNQPEGYHRGITGYQPPKDFHCKKHDYIYYPTSWVDSETGTAYEKGYYDETGKHYKDVIFKDKSTNEIKYVCDYCGTEVKAAWQSGIKPTCPNCTAQLVEAEIDELLPPGARNPLFGTLLRSVLALSIVIFGIVILSLSAIRPSTDPVRTIPNDTTIDATMEATTAAPSVSPAQPSNSYYVEELGRYCPWLPSYESYYDQVTDCYFWYNDTIDHPSWQYWYESISSDFGDYGWMEYDEVEQKWYIEVSDSQWSVLPEKYNTDDLWYIHVIYK